MAGAKVFRGQNDSQPNRSCSWKSSLKLRRSCCFRRCKSAAKFGKWEQGKDCDLAPDQPQMAKS